MNEQVFKNIPASVADAENWERGQYVAKGHQHPIMEHWGGSCSSQCSTTGVTKAVVCIILSVG